MLLFLREEHLLQLTWLAFSATSHLCSHVLSLEHQALKSTLIYFLFFCMKLTQI